MENIFFGNEEKLIIRLKNATKKRLRYTFLFGSGLTSSTCSDPGVLNTAEIINEVEKRLIHIGGENVLKQEYDLYPQENKYQIAMRVLLECDGQEALNDIIKSSVLNAMVGDLTAISEGRECYEDFERQVKNWNLLKGVEALGSLYVNYPDSFVGPILTTNFDPLVEISIRRSNGIPQSVFLTSDGSFDNIISEITRHVVHLHGYWYGSDTLHTIDQITRNRPKTKGCLRKLLKDTTLVVCGYGGWDDVFTKTLIELVNESGNDFNIIWTFFESSEKEIKEKHQKFLEKCESAIGQRLVLYKGIDCNSFFPKLLNSLNEDTLIDENNKNKINYVLKSTFVEPSRGKIGAFQCDVPPNIRNWVGRQTELENIGNENFKVVFLTGFGGQGKSTLAAEYIRQTESSNCWEFWDWRDCKEENHRLHTTIVSAIERLTNGRIRAFHLIDYDFRDLVDTFFSELGNRKIIFVFDNVDRYIDLENFLPARGLDLLFNQANRRKHSSKFIFTCRPHIKYNSGDFLQIKLVGLTQEETVLFFSKYETPLKQNELAELANESHKITNGHPLWLNLIIAQAVRGREIVHKFVDDIKSRSNDSDESSYLAENTLRTVWNSLNSKQKSLLCGMSETVKAETEETLSKILEGVVNYNQFRKALKTLKSLNLIVEKTTQDENDLLELHPLVKEFVKANNTAQDRYKYITLFVNHFNKVILVLKPKLDSNSPLSFFENWTNKIELLVNKNDYESALASLREIDRPIRTAGHLGEFLRISQMLFININWEAAIRKEYKYFHEQFTKYVKVLIEDGKFQDADNLLKKYANSISGKGVHFIRCCDLRCYYYWYQGEFTEAIHWGEQGRQLIINTDIGTETDCEHNLALARRDSKDTHNIDKSIKFFLSSTELDEALSNQSLDKHASFFGNIGRALYFKGDFDKSLTLLKRSLKLLFSEKDENTTLNIGYASFWIGDLFFDKNELLLCYKFYRNAHIFWGRSSPHRAKQAEKRLDNLTHDSFVDSAKQLSDWDIEKYCREWANK